MAFYIYQNNRQSGPYEESFIRDSLRRGTFSLDDLACREGETRWQPLSAFFPLEAGRSGEFREPPKVHQWMKDSANLTGEQQNPGSTYQQPRHAPPPPQPHRTPPPQYQTPPPQYQTPPQTHQPPAYAPVYQPAYQPPPINQYGAPPPQPPPAQSGNSGLPGVGMTLGIVTMTLMLIGLVPCFGWVNWMTLFVGGLTNLLCWAAVFTEKSQEGRNKALIGLVLTFIALFVGSIRLVIGAGCF